MMRSLRSRLIVGMLLGMAVLLIAADIIIYSVQRRQLYRAFDDTLLSSANSLTLLMHPGPHGLLWFDSEGLARLPADRIRQGALFQFWSSRRIQSSPFKPDPNLMEDMPGPPGHRRREPPSSRLPLILPGLDWPPGPPPFEPPDDAFEPRPPLAPQEPNTGAFTVRSTTLNGVDLPRLEASLGQPRYERMPLPGGGVGRAIGLRFQLFGMEQMFGRAAPGEMTLVVAAETTEIEKQLGFLAGLLVVTALGTMAISGGVAWLVVSRGLHPLATVAGKIAAMDETGLKQRIEDLNAPREVEPVVRQLNGLLGRLDEAFDRERALTADVAHELRTPVSEIRAITEITLSRQRDAQTYREALSETLDATKTLQGLIEKLLILARLEAGLMRPELEPVALQPLLVQHWTQIRNRVEPRGVTLESQCDPEAIVSADAKLLEVVLTNVLSNAATYSPDGGRITAQTDHTGTLYQLRIANTGCELSEEEVARVFDRFWRADAARSRTGLNCGLGLTLVRRAMEAMGGEADASISKDRCFVLTLTFSAAGEPD